MSADAAVLGAEVVLGAIAAFVACVAAVRAAAAERSAQWARRHACAARDRARHYLDEAGRLAARGAVAPTSAGEGRGPVISGTAVRVPGTFNQDAEHVAARRSALAASLAADLCAILANGDGDRSGAVSYRRPDLPPPTDPADPHRPLHGLTIADLVSHYRRGCRAPECGAAWREVRRSWRSSQLGEGDVDPGVQTDMDEAGAGLERRPAFGVQAVPDALGVLGEHRVDVVAGVVDVPDEVEGRSGDVELHGHEESSRFGRSPVGAGSVNGAAALDTPSADAPTVEAPTDSDGGLSTPVTQVEGPAGGGEASAPPSAAAPAFGRVDGPTIPDGIAAAWVCPCGAAGYVMPDASPEDVAGYEQDAAAHAEHCPESGAW